MSSEEQEMMAKISQLAGRINRFKNEQAGVLPTPPQRPVAQRGGYNPGFHRGAPYPTRYRGGGRGGGVAAHRHRTLVLNGANTPAKATDAESEPASDSSSSPWVIRNDRHRQLINASVYEKDAKARTMAMEQTRLQARTARDQRERAKLMGHFRRVTDARGSTNVQGPYEVTIDGVRFLVTKNGSKLIKAPDNNNSAKATPKTAVVAGVRFYRSKNGNLYRHGIVKAQRRTGAVKKVDVPCREFSTTGSCRKGPSCRYKHDPSRVAACKEFLQKGQCINGDACDLSHDLTPERTPTCLHFARDHCTNPSCRYAHVKVSPGAPVCRSFGILGYCEKGAQCEERHAYECPDFSNTGVCKTKGCKLLHRERASVLRKNGAAQRDKNSDQDEEMEDVSSDDDGDSIDSDDVDSDEVEEFIGEEDGSEFEQQKDFIRF
ncbi:Zinc finger CCCH domain-containing protein 3 [Coniochaeta hoffmannii]|uniref:Zinc finger CCCH domain-containing protein 3 n=1 Tax=Coniochaeta hoffmannii TaxID=91930 RepID=A0AA38RUB3_9PEZI|nr:Zinc finger CCCH domain-containing protein 3 [Coniochaeta hoffmannii]